jgi:hypothetical protein
MDPSGAGAPFEQMQNDRAGVSTVLRRSDRIALIG